MVVMRLIIDTVIKGLQSSPQLIHRLKPKQFESFWIRSPLLLVLVYVLLEKLEVTSIAFQILILKNLVSNPH